MKPIAKSWWMAGMMSLLAACLSEKPSVVASNCNEADGCGKHQEALHLDAVDILLVIDNSRSIAPQAEQLKAELPRLLTAIVSGQDEEMTFPPANSVHVAVTTSDIGIGTPNSDLDPCTDTGNDGVFVKPGEVGVTCDVSYPGYLAYEAGAAPIETANSVACVPLVFSDLEGDNVGCGFEQPLEAALKALWPASDSSIEFVSGTAHGADENQGFLRDNSLLVVVIVTDEDDCSTSDSSIFQSPDGNNQDLNVRCINRDSTLFDVQRYIEHFRGLRPNNDNVIFATIAGVPADLIAEEHRGNYDFDVPEQRDAYYDDVLDDPRMQNNLFDRIGVMDMDGGTSYEYTNLTPSCVVPVPGIQRENFEGVHRLYPPRRLVQLTKAFGTDGVLGSLCADDFGATTGRLIHAIGERLSDATQPKAASKP